MLKLHVCGEDARLTFLDDFDRATGSGKWMAASWRITVDGKLEMFRTTYDFPRDRFQEAVDTLVTNLREEKEPPREPLAVAPEFMPNVGKLAVDEKDNGEIPPLRDVCSLDTAIDKECQASYEDLVNLNEVG